MRRFSKQVWNIIYIFKICRRETAEQHRLVISFFEKKKKEMGKEMKQQNAQACHFFFSLYFLPSGGLSHLEFGGDDGKHNLIVAVSPRVRIRHGYVDTLHVLSKLDILVPEVRYFSTRAGGLVVPAALAPAARAQTPPLAHSVHRELCGRWT